jgi:hypothetical protein
LFTLCGTRFYYSRKIFWLFFTNFATADAIFELLKRVLESLKFDLNSMVGQSYDGAATMSGIKTRCSIKVY